MKLRSILFVLLIFPMMMVNGCSPHEEFSSSLKAPQSPRGQFKGFLHVNQIITKRVLTTAGSSDLAKLYLSDEGYNLKERVTANMGIYVAKNGESKFVNGTPNSVSMSLWSVLMNRLSCDLAPLCKYENQGPTYGFPSRADALENFVKDLSTKTTVNKEDLEVLWLQVMSFDAPREEFLAWRQDVMVDPRTENFAMWLESIFLNPYFLLN